MDIRKLCGGFYHNVYTPFIVPTHNQSLDDLTFTHNEPMPSYLRSDRAPSKIGQRTFPDLHSDTCKSYRRLGQGNYLLPALRWSPAHRLSFVQSSRKSFRNCLTPGVGHSKAQDWALVEEPAYGANKRSQQYPDLPGCGASSQRCLSTQSGRSATQIERRAAFFLVRSNAKLDRQIVHRWVRTTS